ncbi:hypothetical protein ACPCSE_29280 [Streptomyces cellulosae]
MAATYSATMLRHMLEALSNRRADGRYEIFAPTITLHALVKRGAVERDQVTRHQPIVHSYLTEEAVTYLREALTIVMGQEPEERAALWSEVLDSTPVLPSVIRAFLGLPAEEPQEAPVVEVPTEGTPVTFTYGGETHTGQVLSAYRTHDGRCRITATTEDGSVYAMRTDMVDAVPIADLVRPASGAEERHERAEAAREDVVSERLAAEEAKALELRREPWRGGQICGWQMSYGTGGPSGYCGRFKALGERLCAQHQEEHGEEIRRWAHGNAEGLALVRTVWGWSVFDQYGDLCASADDRAELERSYGFALLWEPYEGTEPVEPTEEERAAFEAAHAAYVEPLPFRVAVRSTMAREFDPADNRVTRCERCGDVGFLARDWDDAEVPALCVECHEKGGTEQADGGHQCEDWCGLGTDHDGLCAPGDDEDDATHAEEEATELLGDGEEWMRHFRREEEATVTPVDRREALSLVTMAVRHGDWTLGRRDGGVTLVSPDGASSYWLQPVPPAEEVGEAAPIEEMGTEDLLQVLREEAAGLPEGSRLARAWAAMDRILTNGGIECLPAAWDGYGDAEALKGADEETRVNLTAAFMPQDPQDETTRPCVEIDGAQVYTYRKDGVLRVSVDLDTAKTVRDDGTVPMRISVGGSTVFEG